MKRFTLSVILVGLLVAACSSGASPTSAPTAVASASVAATTTAAPKTAPSPTPEAVTAAVAFDGKSCTYTGPTDLARGSEVTFSLVTTPAAHDGLMGGGLAVAGVADGTTEEQTVNYMETHPASVAPPFAIDLGRVALLAVQDADQGETITEPMYDNLYAVYVATPPDKTDKGYFCTLLRVFDR